MSSLVQEDVLWLEVPLHHGHTVQLLKNDNNLHHVDPGLVLLKAANLPEVGELLPTITSSITRQRLVLVWKCNSSLTRKGKLTAAIIQLSCTMCFTCYFLTVYSLLITIIANKLPVSLSSTSSSVL